MHLLPQLEQGTLQKTWDFSDPMNNTLGGLSATTTTVLPVLLCPSDVLDQNPVLENGVYYGLTSYGGNGGTRSYFPSSAAVDGVFHTTDSASEPNPGQRPVRMRQITDGSSKTLLLGERRHNDANYETFAALGWADSLKTWGAWGPSGGRKAIGHVTMSAYPPINYQLPFNASSTAGVSPPADSGVAFGYYVDMRTCAWGSNHSGGANFALADGCRAFPGRRNVVAGPASPVNASRRRVRFGALKRKSNQSHHWKPNSTRIRGASINLTTPQSLAP